MATTLDMTDHFDDVLLDDSDSPMVQWSLDDLDRSADLGSVRIACAGADGFDD